MNTLSLILEILQLAAAAASAYVTGDAAKGTQIAQSLISIIQKGMLAYQAQTGQPIDPALLKPWEPIP